MSAIQTCRLMVMEPERARRYLRYCEMAEHRRRVAAVNAEDRSELGVYGEPITYRVVTTYRSSEAKP